MGSYKREEVKDMTNFTKKIATAVATGSLLLNTLTPLAFAETTIEITGNGADSTNAANVAVQNNTGVSQQNNAYVTNNVSVDSSTGDNEANDNGSGEVSIDTGDANADVSVSNSLNVNEAQVDCCEPSDTTVEISENLRDSDNTVNLAQSNNTGVAQYNNAYVTNNVSVEQETGDNEANDNIGGSVDVDTGNADADVKISTVANANSAMVGGNGGEGSSVYAAIHGNGQGTDNEINLAVERDLELLQSNNAYVYNYVYVDQDTGENDANDNGGDVSIDTGNAMAKVDVDNMVNFNWADVDCGCLLDIRAKIGENLEDSENAIRAAIVDDREILQGNLADLWNDTYVEQETGDNEANDNINGDGDPSIDTGDANSEDVNVSNSGNVNSFGTSFDLPDELEDLLDDLSDMDFEFSFNFGGLLGFLSLLS